MFKLVVLSLVLAVAAAKPSWPLGLAGLAAPYGALGLGAHLGGPLGAHLAGPLAAPLATPIAGPVWGGHGLAPTVAVAAPLHGAAYNYRGPLSLAPGQPANIVATDGRPLDTLSVNVDKALHYTARAVDHAGAAHILGKRSAPLLAPAAAWSHAARIDVPVAHGWGAPLAASPLAWRAPIAPLGVGHWGGIGHAGALGHLW